MAAVTGSTNVTSNFTQTVTAGLPGSAGVSYTTQPGWTGISYGNGTAANQVDLLYSKKLTLAATPTTIDLTALTDVFGNVVNMARVRHITIANLNTVDGQTVTVGNAAANPWLGILGGTAPTFPVPAGGTYKTDAPLATGLPVSGTSKSLKLDPGANTITVEIIIAGCSA